MARVFCILSGAVLLVVFAAVGNAQQAPATDSVAGAAREQKALHSGEAKTAPKKVYTNSDVVSPDASPSGDASKSDTQASHADPAVVKNSGDPNSGVVRSSILDRPKKDLPETMVVPGGTKITVDVSEENPPRNLPLRVHSAKVVNIVQVGSTTVIPALSKVTIQESAGVMQLTDVTIDGVHYELQTDRVPILAGSVSEATFTLTKPFTVKR